MSAASSINPRPTPPDIWRGRARRTAGAGGTALLATLVLTLLTGLLFPLLLAAIARPLFPHQADGSLIERHGRVIGSDLIGQPFASLGTFHPRPSAAGTGYDASQSSGTNLGPNNAKQRTAVVTAATAYRHENGLAPNTVIPIDAVTASGSGLDPHISPANAILQVARVAAANHLPPDQVARLVADHVEGRQFGLLGAPRVSVLALNQALADGTAPRSISAPQPDDSALRWGSYALFLAIVIALALPVGRYLAGVFDGDRAPFARVLGPVERALYRLLRVDPAREMTAPQYLVAFILFGVAGTLLLFAVLMLQAHLPLGPNASHLTTPMTSDLAADTAVSFATTTTWQSYGGETTIRYATTLIGLVAQNFLAGAAGLAIGIAFIRGFARRSMATIGNFWVDTVRALLWVLMPLALLLGLLMVWQGVPLNLSDYTGATTLEGGKQIIAQGPVAALEGIKQLGTNGGGFFNVNGAHPFANPTPLTNFLILLAIAVLPAALTMTFGQMVGRLRAGAVLLAVMVALFVAALVICDRAEHAPPPQLAGLYIAGGNMEGKEVRFGVGDSVLAAVVTSNGATGSTNSMHDSYQPVAVAVPLFNMLLGELVFGGLGTGFYSMMMTALVAVFLGGLMIGRTPAYLDKTLHGGEAKLVILYALVGPITVLAFTALAVVSSGGLAGLTTNVGPHGFTEIFYAYTSAVANNGQAMAGLSANAPFFNWTLIIAMLAGRFGLAIFALLLAGRFAGQGERAVTAGSLPVDNVTFALLVTASILILGGLNFLPALALGPAAEQLQVMAH